MTPDFSGRFYYIDTLRGVCCLLVIIHHWKLGPFPEIMVDASSVGVDIFFVLSGVLVSKTLIRDGAQIDLYAFMVKRSLCIYPIHYIYVFFAVLCDCIFNGGIKVSCHNFFGEIFYLQNFVGRLHGHTWSLAVEEHFYLLLPLTLMISGSKFPVVCKFVFFITFMNRLLQTVVWGWDGSITGHLFETYFRIDGLFAGALMTWYKQHNPEYFDHWVSDYPTILCGFGFLWLSLSSLLACLDKVFFHYIASYPNNTLASLVIVHTLTILSERSDLPHSLLRTILYPLSFIGFYSYAVYLFHYFFIFSLHYAVAEAHLFAPHWGLFICILASVFTGWLVSILINPLSARHRKHLPCNGETPCV